VPGGMLELTAATPIAGPLAAGRGHYPRERLEVPSRASTKPMRFRLALASCTLIFALCPTELLAAPPQPPEEDTWLARLYDTVASDLALGKPLVVHVHVPLCSNELIWCGNARLGDGDSPGTNLYWATSGGFRGWFKRRDLGWTHVHRGPGADHDVLEVMVWKKRVAPGRAWRERGVTKPFDAYVVAWAWRGTAMQRAIDAYVEDLYGSKPRTQKLDGGVELQAGGAAHVVAFVGHNGWMDIPPYDWATAAARAGNGPPKGTIAIACMTAPYLAPHVPAETRIPLLMTTGLMFAGAHGFEGAVSAFAHGHSFSRIREAAATNHATGQEKPVRAVRGLFTNPADPRWRSNHRR
jgi:hypothetical protein